MSAATELTVKLLGAVHAAPGLQPAAPSVMTRGRLPSWNPESLAVDLSDEEVVIRVVATRLPLPPLLRGAGAALAAVLSRSAWSSTRLRLVVTDLDRAALDDLDA
ncbi:MAG: hypothetical protein ACRDSE_10175 [Pseudonocardiaceae bacterium]